MPPLALTELLGAPVFDSTGKASGRVREVALTPQEDRVRISTFIVRTRTGDRLVPLQSITAINGGIRSSSLSSDWIPSNGMEGLFLLERDLLDQQVIDVYGRKVVRVNDVDLHQESIANRPVLKVGSVDVGARGAVRRLLKGVVPLAALQALLANIPARLIPWEFVDLIETDPARRVKLKISHDRLAKLHPADIADIIEELAPDEREAVFETLDEQVAAEALEEVDPKVQKSIVESLDSNRVAEIVEEMQPDAAADLLADLSQEKTESILEEMGAEEREEVSGLLEFKENSAAGRMTTEYISLPVTANVADAIEALRHFEGGIETISTVFLVDSRETLAGTVPLAKMVVATPATPLLALTQEPLISCLASANDREVAELFDKYNLLNLPVVDNANRLSGVITSDDVISLLRQKL
jgi:magnesium transporter